jgi:hypothetical protein
MFNEPKNRFQGTYSTRLCDLVGHYDNPIPTRYQALKQSLVTTVFWLADHSFGVYNILSTLKMKFAKKYNSFISIPDFKFEIVFSTKNSQNQRWCQNKIKTICMEKKTWLTTVPFYSWPYMTLPSHEATRFYEIVAYHCTACTFFLWRRNSCHVDMSHPIVCTMFNGIYKFHPWGQKINNRSFNEVHWSRFAFL